MAEVQRETIHTRSNLKGPGTKTTGENEKHSTQQDPSKDLLKTE